MMVHLCHQEAAGDCALTVAVPSLQGKGSHGGKGPKTFGPAMHAAGRAWIGKVVLRYWEDQGGWWEALVGDYSVKNSKHKLIYDAGGEDVSTLPLYCPVSLPGDCYGAMLAVALVLSVSLHACQDGLSVAWLPVCVRGRWQSCAEYGGRQIVLMAEAVCAVHCRRALSGQTCAR